MQPDLKEQFYAVYLLDIFAALNILNLEMHDCNQHIVVFYSRINAFKAKIKLSQT